ncbi:unnamed protein product [Rhizoctonia solani]|uniref:SnoaL-like domain-containing protein n=1 Tax=Rhizoctonia solani TaxID=456999 RepID=A0A8H3BF01_9AGAM|nr:unnamed protein product [Rhizoctonia solani]CAE6458057.1 unnamed protein product [Rhizoctonia solani]
MSSSEIPRLAAELAEFKQKFDNVIEAQRLSNLIHDYALYHDKCFGSKAGPEDDSNWENLFDISGTCDLHPMGLHQGREGKMAWAQQVLGGRGRGCQVRLFNTRVYLDESDPGLATACSYAIVEFVPGDVSNTIIVKGHYDWAFKKVGNLWKITFVKLSPFPEQEA